MTEESVSETFKQKQWSYTIIICVLFIIVMYFYGVIVQKLYSLS